jgi:hypothetical protein
MGFSHPSKISSVMVNAHSDSKASQSAFDNTQRGWFDGTLGRLRSNFKFKFGLLQENKNDIYNDGELSKKPRRAYIAQYRKSKLFTQVLKVNALGKDEKK